MPGASDPSKGEKLDRLVADLQRLRPDAHEHEFKGWRDSVIAAMSDVFGPRHRLTLALRDVTFTPDFARGRARALALLRAASSLSADPPKPDAAPTGPTTMEVPAQRATATVPAQLDTTAAPDWPDTTAAPEQPATSLVPERPDAAIDLPEMAAAAATAGVTSDDAPTLSCGAIDLDAFALPMSEAVLEPTPDAPESKHQKIFRRLARRRDSPEALSVFVDEPCGTVVGEVLEGPAMEPPDTVICDPAAAQLAPAVAEPAPAVAELFGAAEPGLATATAGVMSDDAPVQPCGATDLDAIALPMSDTVFEPAPDLGEPKRQTIVRRFGRKRDSMEPPDTVTWDPAAAQLAPAVAQPAPAAAQPEPAPASSAELFGAAEPTVLDRPDAPAELPESDSTAMAVDNVSAQSSETAAAATTQPMLDTAPQPTPDVVIDSAAEPTPDAVEPKRAAGFERIARKRDSSVAHAAVPNEPAEPATAQPSPAVAAASTKPGERTWTEPGATASEPKTSWTARTAVPVFDTSWTPPAAPYASVQTHREASRRPKRGLKRVTVAAIVIVLLELAVGIPVWLGWVGGLSGVFGLGSTTVTSTATSLSSPGAHYPSADARVVDLAGDPRSAYIVEVVQAGIVQLQPNEAGEVSFLPTERVRRGEFLVWLDRVWRIPVGSREVPDTFYYDLVPPLRNIAIDAYHNRIVLEWPGEDTRVAFKAANPILVRDAEAWTARMVIGLLPATALQSALGITEADALDLRARISSLQPQELAAVADGFKLLPAGGWATEKSISRSEAAEFLMKLKAAFARYLPSR